MTAVIYARYSSDSQREASIEGQLRDCKDYAEKNGITVVGTSLFGVSKFAIDTNPLMVGGLTLGLAALFLVAAYVSARKVKRVDVRELVAE